MNLNGVIAIDKPAEWTSHDVVAKLRSAIHSTAIYKASKQKMRVGHGGTLDPMATGVLPIFIGRATRAAEFCENADKEYIAGLKLGMVTDTQDITGKVLRENSVSITEDELKSALVKFLGQIKQIPPMFSAIKQDGKKLYDLARQGKEISRPARDIEIYAIELLDRYEVIDAAALENCDNVYYLRVACSKGTYIRTLCHDIGTSLGCGATLSYLRRTRAGAYTIDDAHTLDSILSMLLTETVSNILLPIDSMFQKYPAITLSDIDTKKAKNGALRLLHNNQQQGKSLVGITDGTYRFYSNNGEFLFLGEVICTKLRVIKSFFEV